MGGPIYEVHPSRRQVTGPRSVFLPRAHRTSDPWLHTGLTVSAPTDASEQQAERVSHAILDSTGAEPSQKRAKSGSYGPDRYSAGIRDATLPAPTGLLGSVMNSPGQPLDDSSRHYFEPRFGHDFSRVRIHSDDRATASTRTLGASAYTFGQHVVFEKGQYAPSTLEGRRLLAHELAHVVQQNGGHPHIQRGGKVVELTPAERFDWDVAILRSEIDRFGTLAPEEQLDRMEFALSLLRGLAANPAFADVDPETQREIRDQTTAIDATLRAFAGARENNLERVEKRNVSWAAVGAVAVLDGPEPGPADAVALLYGLGALLFAGVVVTTVARDPDLVSRQAAALAQTLRDIRSILGSTVLMTAAGNVIHDHIVNEARELAVALGLAASAAAVTREILCQMLDRMAKQNRRSDSAKWKKIISTQKGLHCRGSTADRE
jgi:hypothetical protein